MSGCCAEEIVRDEIWPDSATLGSKTEAFNSVVYSGWGLVGSDPTSSKCRQLICIGAPELSPNISSRSPTSF